MPIDSLNQLIHFFLCALRVFATDSFLP
jgi:hypothetical protein